MNEFKWLNRFRILMSEGINRLINYSQCRVNSRIHFHCSIVIDLNCLTQHWASID